MVVAYMMTRSMLNKLLIASHTSYSHIRWWWWSIWSLHCATGLHGCIQIIREYSLCGTIKVSSHRPWAFYWFGNLFSPIMSTVLAIVSGLPCVLVGVVECEVFHHRSNCPFQTGHTDATAQWLSTVEYLITSLHLTSSTQLPIRVLLSLLMSSAWGCPRLA